MNYYHTFQKYKWYNPARVSVWRTSGEGGIIARLLLRNRPLLSTELLEIDMSDIIAQHRTQEQEAQAEQVEVSQNESDIKEEDIIETFLKCDNLRIVADNAPVAESNKELTLEVELEDIDDLVTEELAEIYSAQELIDEAIAIYTRLSLLNSEKSSYFAELIAKMEQNRENN